MVVVPRKKPRRGGPRTPIGKQRASRNSLRHGIFARDLVIGEESFEEYEELLRGFLDSLQPVGQVEELLVEKLAVYTWRHRRLLRAEAAEIGVLQLQSAPSQGDRIRSLQLAKSFWPNQGSIARAFLSHDEASLFSGMGILKELRERIGENGLDWERDRSDLEELYGPFEDVAEKGDEESPDPAPTTTKPQAQTMCQRYRLLSLAFQTGDKGARAKAKKNILQDLYSQIEHLQPVALAAHERKARAEELRIHARAVPEAETVERLLRYEAALERGFDRALSQLERLQRIRLGQAVLPPVRVELSR